MNKTIKFVGWYGQRNIGDEAFRLAHDALFPDCEKSYSIDSLDDPDSIVILGGGDVVLPYYLDQIPESRDFFLLGCGLGYQQEIEELKGKNVRHAVFRNVADVELARDAGLRADFAPDITFAIDPSGYRGLSKLSDRVGAKKRLCILLTDQISPSPWHSENSLLSYFDYFKWELASSIDYLSKFYDVYWLPFSDHENDRDLRILYDVLGRMKKRENSLVLPYPENPGEALSLMSEMDLVVSMKFHGAMFSTNLGVPFVNIGISRKTQIFCEANGYSSLSVKPFCFTRDSFLNAVKAAEDEGVSQKLSEDSQSFRAELMKIKSDILDKWCDTDL